MGGVEDVPVGRKKPIEIRLQKELLIKLNIIALYITAIA